MSERKEPVGFWKAVWEAFGEIGAALCFQSEGDRLAAREQALRVEVLERELEMKSSRRALPDYVVLNIIDQTLWDLSQDPNTGFKQGGSAFHRKLVSDAVLQALKDGGALS